MNNLKNKIKTKSFWLSVVAAVILILQNVGLTIDVPYVDRIVESVCTLLMLLGIFTAPAATKPEQVLPEPLPDKTINAQPPIANNEVTPK